MTRRAHQSSLDATLGAAARVRSAGVWLMSVLLAGHLVACQLVEGQPVEPPRTTAGGAAGRPAANSSAKGTMPIIEAGLGGWIEELVPGTVKSRARIPPPLTIYQGRRIAPYMSYLGAEWLLRETRVREENPDLLMKALDAKPGQWICDMGSGNGYYSLKLAQQVGAEGRIVAVDIQPEMLKLLRQRMDRAGVRNILPTLGTVVDPRLPKAKLDMVLLVDVYHEFSHPEQMLKAIRSSLKPGGQMVLVEFRAEDPMVLIKPEHKMTKAQILKEIPPNGFKLVKEFNDLPWQHVMFFEAADGQPKVKDVSE